MQQTHSVLPGADTFAPVRPLAASGATTRMMFHMMSEWTRESAHFVGLRMERYADLQMALARCTTPLGTFDCMMNFAKQSMDDYSREAERCPKLLSRMSEEALVDLEAELQPEKAPSIE